MTASAVHIALAYDRCRRELRALHGELALPTTIDVRARLRRDKHEIAEHVIRAACKELDLHLADWP